MVTSVGEERQACHLLVVGIQGRSAGGWEAECGEIWVPLSSVLRPEVGGHFLFPARCPLRLYHDWVWAPKVC